MHERHIETSFDQVGTLTPIELGIENRGERKLKGVNWPPKFEKFEKLC